MALIGAFWHALVPCGGRHLCTALEVVYDFPSLVQRAQQWGLERPKDKCNGYQKQRAKPSKKQRPQPLDLAFIL